MIAVFDRNAAREILRRVPIVWSLKSEEDLLNELEACVRPVEAINAGKAE